MHLVHLSVRGVHTENSASNTQENTVQQSKDNPSGEGLSNRAKMADCYTSKIQAIIQNNSGMTLQEKNELIRDLLQQAQNDREIQLLRKISIPANRNVLVGSGPQGNTDNNHNNNNNQNSDNNNQNNNNSNNQNNDNGTIATHSAPSQPPVNDSKADNGSNNIKNKDNSKKNGQRQPAQKQKEKKQTKGQKRKTKIWEDDNEEEENDDNEEEEDDDQEEGEQEEDEEEEEDDNQEEEEEDEEEDEDEDEEDEGTEVEEVEEEENDEEENQEGEQEEEEWDDEDEDRDESESEDRKKKKDKREKPQTSKRASIGSLLKPSFTNIRLHCQRAKIAFPKQKLSRLYETLSTYLSCPLKNGFESLDRRFVLTPQQRVLFQSPHRQISMSLEKLSVSLILPRATLFKYLTARLKQERARIPYTYSDKILIRNFIRLSKLKRTSVPCVALRGNT